jgi:hypothetical protein
MPWQGVILEKLKVIQLVKKFPAFMKPKGLSQWHVLKAFLFQFIVKED